MVQGGGGRVVKVEISHDIRGIDQVIGWEPLIVGVQCRQENGSMCIPPMETSFGHWNTSLLSLDEDPIIGRIFAGNPNIWFFRCLPNRDVISSLNLPNSHDQNGGTYVQIGGLLKEK